MENKRPSIYLPIFFALTLILGILLGITLIPAMNGKSGLFSLNPIRYDKFSDVMNYISNDYVDTINKKILTEKAINSLLESLDPHSTYISAEEFNNANDPLIGNFDGIGVQFRVIRDTITVINTVPGGPSEQQGILGGDRILKIDGKNVASIKIKDTDVMKQLKGKRGTKVLVSIFRRGEKNLRDFFITRNVIPTNSVDYAFMVNPNVGYIKLSKFSSSTADEVHRWLNKLKEMGMTKLIFDLRGNGGGYLDAAISIADEFLPDKKLIVYTEGSHRTKKSYYATADGQFEDKDLVILIDEFTASASEIVSGAIQDNDRGMIIGRRSFGKGLVQEQIQLGDGSAIRLTVARYHTPTGRCIQKPYTSDYEKYYMDFYKSLMEEDAEAADSLNLSDTIKYKTPKGKTVYGGGGIMPDVYVPFKSEFISDYYRKILNKGLIYDFGFDYADKNRLVMKSYGSASKYISQFVVTPTILNEFVAYAEKNGVKRDEAGLKAAETTLKALLKGTIGRNIFDDAAFYPAILPTDKVFQKALEVFSAK
ncbi:MAG: S41 family peptidase [Bacteroidota bacterium]